MPSDPGGPAAVVAVGFVAVPHRLPEAVLSRVGDERVALGGMPRDAVEDGADHLAGGHPEFSSAVLHASLAMMS